ncbi:hypothetical protein [Actinomadura rifamycini]|uniref:hypothetical protein n=1 Tax=Actinomadura rifamycini TaxID=31962 RepID=UPI0004298121|nr:hypothetical protein [Actinomadura rifamycini]
MRRGVRAEERIIETAVKVAGLVVSGLLVWFFFSIVYEVSAHNGRSIGAVYGRAGEPGTLTVTGDRPAGGRGSGRRCVGTFVPAGGGPAVTEIPVAVGRGRCEAGRTERARFVPGYDSLLRTEPDKAYGRTAGAGGLIVALVFVDLFCGLLGLMFAIYTFAFGGSLVTGLRRRVGSSR